MKKQIKNKPKTFYMLITGLLIIVLCVIVLFTARNFDIFGKNKGESQSNVGANTVVNNENPNDGKEDPDPVDTETPEEIERKRLEEEKKRLEEEKNDLLKKAENIALGYDYDKAIEHLKSYSGNYLEIPEITDAIASYEATKATLVPLGAYDSVDQISHVFFHSLIADTKLAFDGDYKENGYNYYMTTVDETIAMFEQMHERGYVLVSIHDVGKKVTGEDGKEKYVAGDIMLPADKKPFVISQDDTNYYEYMAGDGFATRAAIDEKGRPSTEIILEDGTSIMGDFDLAPVLETFLETHPDFSYRGARGILALTGYEGTLGYRTNDKSSPTYEQDLSTVKEVVKVYKEWGWEFASHSYGHRDMTKASYEFTVKDTNRWLEEVGSIVGPTDVYIFPYGADIETTLGHYESNKYNFLKEQGFDYFSGVYSKPWIHIKDDYVRMTRRPLDGQAMLQFPERLEDLFDVDTVVNKTRPALR